MREFYGYEGIHSIKFGRMKAKVNGMHRFALILGFLTLTLALLDAFQTIILPRRPVGRFRITRLFFLATWTPWVRVARLIQSSKARDQFYSFYGPLSLLLLFIVWATLLAGGYGLIFFGLHTPFSDPFHPGTLGGELRTALYVSGSTIFTLGLGDVVPATLLARALVVLEAGTGLGFVALVIGYVPVLYTAFSQREIAVALLDARAGSPPTASELLVRHSFTGGNAALIELLAEWERWCATLLETHISYPLLCYYRSQHDNQSWLAALTAILDTCALLITTVEGPATRQAQLTFAVGRHVLVDIVHVFRQESMEIGFLQQPMQRLDDDEFARLCEVLGGAGFALCGDIEAHARLQSIRRLYEPSACAMGHFLALGLPRWVPPPRDPSKRKDNWTTVADLRTPSALADRLSTHLSPLSTADHFGEDERH
ncbi:Ion channel [Bryocella elongata]|uniref:Ion channel n=2 Tax=Bryocella elongata TaxID=863522 RepID=A0A1H5W6F9_9BACT|nr:Ion channel [Bryocella elongata]